MAPNLHPLACSKCGAPLEAAPSQAFLRCAYCGTTHAFLPPPPPEPPELGFSPGERVAVEWGGRWWPGTIVRGVRPGVWLVHYEGWDARWDEEVERSRIRHPAFAGGAARGPTRLVIVAVAVAGVLAAGVALAVFSVGSRPSPGAASGRATARDNAKDYTPGARYVEGEAVQVFWGSSWWDGSIKEVRGEEYLIGYDGYGSGSDEVVGLGRLKKKAGEPRTPPKATAVASAPPTAEVSAAAAEFGAGQAVQIEWRGTWWKGQILEVKAKDRYLIHYDGYASSWDEVVGPERLKPR